VGSFLERLHLLLAVAGAAVEVEVGEGLGVELPRAGWRGKLVNCEKTSTLCPRRGSPAIAAGGDRAWPRLAEAAGVEEPGVAGRLAQAQEGFEDQDLRAPEPLLADAAAERGAVVVAHLVVELALLGLGRSKILVLRSPPAPAPGGLPPGLLDPAASASRRPSSISSCRNCGRSSPRITRCWSSRSSPASSPSCAGSSTPRPSLPLPRRAAPRPPGKVESFQNDPTSRLFLISLKAGGLGLTSPPPTTSTCSIPGGNPAVEAQAIDRAHRIGQERPVSPAAWSPATPWKKRSSTSRKPNETSPTPSSRPTRV